MKFLLVSNGNLAREIRIAMQRFYSVPEIDVICLDDMQTACFTKKLHSYLRHTEEEILILCDAWGSAAFNETAYAINKLPLTNRAAIICGMSLPLVFKLYGLKDTYSLQTIQEFYTENAPLDDPVLYKSAPIRAAV